jgi:hypothetical protein
VGVREEKTQDIENLVGVWSSPELLFSCSPTPVCINLTGILRFRYVILSSNNFPGNFSFNHSILLFSFSRMQLQNLMTVLFV